MLDRLTFSTAVEELERRMPSFVAFRNNDESSVSAGDNSPYLVFADFARFLLERVSEQSKSSENDEILRQSFELLDEMLTSSDPELVNLAQVAVLECLAEESNGLAIAKSYLSEEAIALLDSWLQRWLSPFSQMGLYDRGPGT